MLLMGGRHAALPELPVSRHAKSAEEVAREKAAAKAARERAAAEELAEAERRARTPRARLVRAARTLPPVVTRAVVRARKRRRS
jgi:hypothetical protein